MAAIAINDLPLSRALDAKAMSSVRGGRFNPIGAFRAFEPVRPSLMPVNFYQFNTFIADQMNFQVQIIDINNSAPNSSINVALDAQASNLKQ